MFAMNEHTMNKHTSAAQALDGAARTAVIEHMNADHADACLLYARHHAGLAGAQSAVMIDVTLSHMRLEVDGHSIEVAFHRRATGRDDLRAVLVEMVKQARGRDR